MVSIKDVAKKAGVGIATVSRVINNTGYVKESTRKKVEQVIQELEYKPNEIARTMLTQRNHIVALIIPNTMHLFFGELVHYIEQELFNYDYKLLVCNSSEQIEKELVYLEMLKNKRVDAMIMLTNNDIEGEFKEGMPLISFDRKFKNVPYVASDNYGGGVLAANHLIEQGCKNLLFIGDDAQGDSTEVDTDVSLRRIGFMEEAKRQGLEEPYNIEYPLGDYIRVPESVFSQILKFDNVEGVFCISDAVAAETVRYLESNGKRVPEDIKVMGYDGGRSFSNLGKRLTSINQDPSLIAKAIVKIINAYYDKKEVKSEIIPVSFVKGETT